MAFYMHLSENAAMTAVRGNQKSEVVPANNELKVTVKLLKPRAAADSADNSLKHLSHCVTWTETVLRLIFQTVCSVLNCVIMGCDCCQI